MGKVRLASKSGERKGITALRGKAVNPPGKN